MSGSPLSPKRNPPEVEAEDDDEATLVAPSPRSLLVFTDDHDVLKMRLGPLRQVEKDLKRRLGAATDEPVDAPGMPMYATPFDISSRATSPTLKQTGEVVVRSWKHVLERNEELSKNPLGVQGNEMDDTTRVIVGCKDAIKALWEDDVVQAVLKKRKVRLPDSAAL